MNACLIEAGIWLLGFDEKGRELLRYDAALRVDEGMVVQIGAFEAVSYGFEHLPRLGLRGGLGLPLFVSAPTREDRYAGTPGRLTPGSPANLAIFARGMAPSREALTRNEPVVILADGALASLSKQPSAAEAAIWDAAVRLAR